MTYMEATMKSSEEIATMTFGEKKAYWNNRVTSAIREGRKLARTNPHSRNFRPTRNHEDLES